MKPLIIPAVLLIAALLFVIINGFNTEKELTTIIKMSEDLPDEPTDKTLDQIKQIEKKWNKNKEHFSAIIKYDFVFNFSKEISSAKAGIIADDDGTYLAAKKGILNILYYIRDIQRLRFDNVI